MKKNVFLLVLLTMSMMVSCDKEVQQNLTTPINSRTDPNHIEFEHTLNASFISTPMYIKVSKVHTISLSHIDGFISQSEKNRITGEIQTLVNSGVVPVLIDVDPDNSVVEVVEQFNTPSSEEFVQVITDGELGLNGTIVPGTFCNSTTDLQGGGVGRVGTRYFNNYINTGAYPAYHDNVRQVTVYSGCPDFVQVRAGGEVRIRRDNFWKLGFPQNCSNVGVCITDIQLSNNYDVLVNAISNSLGSNYKVVGVRRCFRNMLNNPRQNWEFTFYFVRVLTGPPTYQ